MGRMNKWSVFWFAAGIACLPAALIVGGYTIWTILGIGSLAISGLLALYRPKEN